MGKNQAYKAMQKARLGANAAAPEELNDGMVDGSFHSPEWHAARLASLNKSHTVTWEEFKRKQKEEEMKKGELEADKDRMMREYRAQLDAERAFKLSRGRNHLGSKSGVGKDKKEKDSKKHRSKKRKHSKRYSDSSSSSSSSESSSSDDESGISKSRSKRRKKDFSSSSSESSSSDDESGRTKSRSKRRKKEKKHGSRSKQCSSDKEGANGPLPLSRKVDELDKTISVAARNPSLYGINEAELEKRSRWTSNARGQKQVLAGKESNGLSTSNANGMRRELMRLPHSHQTDRSNQYRAQATDDLISSESDRQLLLIKQQDEELDELSASVERIGGIGLTIHEELLAQERIIDELDTEMDSTSNFVQKKVGMVMKKAGAKGQFMMILFLLVLFVILFVLVFFTWILLACFDKITRVSFYSQNFLFFWASKCCVHVGFL